MTRALTLALALSLLAAANTPSITIEIDDYATMPVTGVLDGKGQTDGLLSRVNALREEPGGANRFFVVDLNGPLYILDKASKTFRTYLDFNGRDGHSGLFHKFAYETGWANGLVTLQFDPDYRRNGKFYTIHIEDPSLAVSSFIAVPGYEATPPIVTPGPILREGVLVEWTDTNTGNATFEGSARELLRVQLNTRIHPLDDLAFNPTARPGDPEWRVMYVSCGDGGSGESRTAIRPNPQRLDTLVGKILRIVPDLAEHATSSTISENGRYRIPNDNPFASTPGARKEIWAYGFRNPHRLHWAIDPTSSSKTHLVANSIGLHTWETVYIVHKGANYGYSQREGTERLQPSNQIAALPDDDSIPVQISDTIAIGAITPTYPVIQYAHLPGGGDAIGSGVLYTGKKLPALRGKYLFADITTGHVWYADYANMLAADDGKPETLAAMHEIQIRWKGETYPTMHPIAEAAYISRGSKEGHLPGAAVVAGNRADANFAVDGSGELYLLTKTDGMIRAVTGAAVK